MSSKEMLGDLDVQKGKAENDEMVSTIVEVQRAIKESDLEKERSAISLDQLVSKYISPRSKNTRMSEACGSKLGVPGWVIFFGSLEVVIILFFGIFTTYGDATSPVSEYAEVPEFYAMFQDVHVMIFVGFGFLMVFLRKHGYSSIGFNFFVAVFVIQWSILVLGFFHNAFINEWHELKLTIISLITADFAAGAVLISFGAVLGRVSAPQLMTMALFEVIFYAINEQIALHEFHVTDVGGSMLVHMFGAYFGISASWILGPKNMRSSNRDDDATSVYHSDLFSMIGTLFLWLFWPSFNGALAGTAHLAQHRVVINTVLSLAASTFVAFLTSKVAKGKFVMEEIQNATLAGGVAVGTCANLVIHPFGALIIGSISGIISVLGYTFLTPFLEKKIRLFDTAGVHNLHGMPGIIGAVAGAIACRMATESNYGAFSDPNSAMNSIFPAVADGYSVGDQAGFQIAALFVTLGIAISTGMLTGLLMSNKYLFAPLDAFYTDTKWWIIPESSTPEFSKRIDDVSGGAV